MFKLKGAKRMYVRTYVRKSLNKIKRIYREVIAVANNESSEVCGIIKPGRRVKLHRSQAVNVHNLLTIRYLHG